MFSCFYSVSVNWNNSFYFQIPSLLTGLLAQLSLPLCQMSAYISGALWIFHSPCLHVQHPQSTSQRLPSPEAEGNLHSPGLLSWYLLDCNVLRKFQCEVTVNQSASSTILSISFKNEPIHWFQSSPLHKHKKQTQNLALREKLIWPCGQRFKLLVETEPVKSCSSLRLNWVVWNLQGQVAQTYCAIKILKAETQCQRHSSCPE